jgi:hypothetical protein
MMPMLRSWILPLAVSAGLLVPLSAQASIAGDLTRFFDLGPKTPVEDIPAPTADVPVAVSAPNSIALNIELKDFSVPSFPTVAVSELPAPSVETPLRKLFCVEYARAITGLNIFGDAKFWWERARNLYARIGTPAEHAVMVFATSPRLKKGHVAVVMAIVSRREIRVDQANWQNQGEIDHATPILDVSIRNDWSEVRVWDMKSRSFGGHVYAISGFIADRPVRQAEKD